MGWYIGQGNRAYPDCQSTIIVFVLNSHLGIYWIVGACIWEWHPFWSKCHPFWSKSMEPSDNCQWPRWVLHIAGQFQQILRGKIISSLLFVSFSWMVVLSLSWYQRFLSCWFLFMTLCYYTAVVICAFDKKQKYLIGTCTCLERNACFNMLSGHIISHARISNTIFSTD